MFEAQRPGGDPGESGPMGSSSAAAAGLKGTVQSSGPPSAGWNALVRSARVADGAVSVTGAQPAHLDCAAKPRKADALAPSPALP